MVNSINSKPSLLYIDDAPEFLLLFQASLKNDYNITTADSAEKGLEFLKTHKIKIIVADQRMPGITGIELLEKVAKEYPDILRFMISAFTDFQSAVDGVNKGRIHGFFNKPINPDEIRIAIAKALEIQILREKNRKIMQELKETNIGLKNTNRNKTIFLQILSRQLSKPINDISGTVQALKDKIDSRELVNLVNLLDDSVSNLKLFSSLAQQITLLEINENKINFTSLNSRELVEYLIIEKTEQLNKRNIKINLQESKKKLLIHGDHYLVINCLINVLENSGVTVGSSGYFDFDNDGESERWVVIRHSPGTPLEFWIMQPNETGVSAIFIVTLETDAPRLTYLEPISEPPIVQIDPDITFQLVNQGPDQEPAVVFVEQEVIFASDRTELELDYLEVTLFTGGDPAYVQQELLILRTSPHFTCSYLLCPRFLYLLGLASELANDERAAVNAYLELWREYINSPYATMARFKLISKITTVPTFTPTKTQTPTAAPTLPGTSGTPSPTITATLPGYPPPGILPTSTQPGYPAP